MKTITEFDSFRLKNAGQKAQELAAAGKTPEECAQAIGEELKMEGDKLKMFMNALEIVKTRGQGLKRIVVMTVGEGEKTPAGAEKKDDHFYLAEFFPLPPEQQNGRRRRGGRGDGRRDGGRKGGRKGGGRRDGRRDGQSQRDDANSEREGKRYGRGRRDRAQASMTEVPVVKVNEAESLQASGKPVEGVGEGEKRRRRRRPMHKGKRPEIKPTGPVNPGVIISKDGMVIKLKPDAPTNASPSDVPSGEQTVSDKEPVKTE